MIKCRFQEGRKQNGRDEEDVLMYLLSFENFMLKQMNICFSFQYVKKIFLNMFVYIKKKMTSEISEISEICPTDFCY